MVLSVGELILDITITPERPLRPNDDTPAGIRVGGGGQAANFCAWAASRTQPARLITRLGDDDTGRRLVAELEALGVEVCPVWAAEPSGMIAILIGPDGERTMATQHGAGIGLRPADLRDEWFEGVRLLHVPAYALFTEPLASAARESIQRVRRRGGELSMDLSSAAGLIEYGPGRMVSDLQVLRPDLLFASAAEAEALGVPLDGLAQIPVVKLGAFGCRLLGQEIAAPVVEELDPTGAGDAFAAAFCVAYLRGESPLEAARHAVSVAALAVTVFGARPG